MHTLKRQHRPTPPDRRSFNRFAVQGLAVRVNGQFVQVIDISLSGMRVDAGFPRQGRTAQFVLIPTVGTSLMVNDGIHGHGEIVHSEGESATIKFNSVTYSLVKMIVRHTSERLGVKPFIVK